MPAAGGNPSAMHSRCCSCGKVGMLVALAIVATLPFLLHQQHSHVPGHHGAQSSQHYISQAHQGLLRMSHRKHTKQRLRSLRHDAPPSAPPHRPDKTTPSWPGSTRGAKSSSRHARGPHAAAQAAPRTAVGRPPLSKPQLQLPLPPMMTSERSRASHVSDRRRRGVQQQQQQKQKALKEKEKREGPLEADPLTFSEGARPEGRGGGPAPPIPVVHYDVSWHRDCLHVVKKSHKYMPECMEGHPLKRSEVLRVLVTGVERSGTHYTWAMLRRLGIDVHHEGLGRDGGVGWLYGHRNMGYLINNPTPLKRQRFHHVFHQVRHPLRTISTILARHGDWDRLWKWIERREPRISQGDAPLVRVCKLVLYWNEHIESHADLRFAVEHTSPRDVCRLAGFPESLCGSHNATQPVLEPLSVPNTDMPLPMDDKAHDGPQAPADTDGSTAGSPRMRATRAPPTRLVTWQEIMAADRSIASRLISMTLRYGYDLDPAAHPVLPATALYAAGRVVQGPGASGEGKREQG